MAATTNRLVLTCSTPPAPAAPTAPALRAVPPREPDYESCVEAVRTAVKLVARRFRLTPTDTEDLHSDLWVRLLADRGLVLRRFHGLAKLETYLVTVSRNLVLDRRNKLWGKWRPSARARRGGPVAVQLERLIVRDGMPPDVALALMRRRHPDVPTEMSNGLAASSAPKVRRRHIGTDVLANCASSDPSPYEVANAHDDARCAAPLASALAAMLEALSPEDRNLLVWRYLDDRSVAEIAKALAVEQRALYRRCEALLGRLKASLAAAGFDAAKVRDLLGAGCDEVRLQIRRHPLPPVGNLRRSA